MDDAALSFNDHAMREDAHAGQVLNTAKLVTTFSSALAATFLVTELQVGQPTFLDYVGAWAMVPVLLITVGIVILGKATLEPSDISGESGASITAGRNSTIQSNFIKNVGKNMPRARWVHRANDRAGNCQLRG